MVAYKQTESDIETILNNKLCMPVAKLPIREMVTKCIPGEKYLCTDTGQESIAKEGEALITRVYPDGSKDTYKNKKGPKYQFEDGKTWETLQPGESAFGKLKDGPEYDRYAIFARVSDTVDAVWDETQHVTRQNAYITVIYANNKFDMSEDGKWGSVQIVLNNNAGDIHPIDVKMHDENGNPVIIGESPLTVHPAVRRQELMRHVARYYNGKVPEHLYPVLENIHAEEMELMKVATRKVENMEVQPRPSSKLKMNDTISVMQPKDVAIEHDSFGISGVQQEDSNWFLNNGFKIDKKNR